LESNLRGRGGRESFIDPEGGIKSEGREICNSTLPLSWDQLYTKPNVIRICFAFGGI
jgi:hypothetical protein